MGGRLLDRHLAILWHQIQFERLVSHYRQLDCWGMYVTAGGAPHLRFPVKIIGAYALSDPSGSRGSTRPDGTETTTTRREDGNIQSTKSWTTSDR